MNGKICQLETAGSRNHIGNGDGDGDGDGNIAARVHALECEVSSLREETMSFECKLKSANQQRTELDVQLQKTKKMNDAKVHTHTHTLTRTYSHTHAHCLLRFCPQMHRLQLETENIVLEKVSRRDKELQDFIDKELRTVCDGDCDGDGDGGGDGDGDGNGDDVGDGDGDGI